MRMVRIVPFHTCVLRVSFIFYLVCCALNVPYRKGLSDASFMHLFDSIFPAVIENFRFALALELHAHTVTLPPLPSQPPGYRAAARCRHPLWRSVSDSTCTRCRSPAKRTSSNVVFASLGGCNVSSSCFPRIVKCVSSLNLPLLLLGGGGYHEVATVKAWVSSTAAACGAELPGTVPLHDFYTDYGPTFSFQHVSTMPCAADSHFLSAFRRTAATQ